MPDADKEDALLDRRSCATGKIYFGTDAVTVDDLTNKVKDRLANKVDKRVFIRADARAKYGSVVDVVDNVRSAGVDDVGLLTEQIQDESSEQETACRRRNRALAPSRESIYGNGNGRAQRALSRYQRNAAD